MKTKSTMFGNDTKENITLMPTISAKELVEDEIKFKIKSVNVKDGVTSKYFPEGHRVAFVVIQIGTTEYLLAASQTVLLKKFAFVRGKLDEGDEEFTEYLNSTEFVIQYTQGKNNEYMDIYEVTED